MFVDIFFLTEICLTFFIGARPSALISFSVESDGNFSGLGTLSQDSSVFTITPKLEDSATTTSSTLTFKASSGTLMTLLFLIFSLALPFFFYKKDLRHITVGMARLLLVLIIPFGFIFAAIFLGESITLTKATGALMVMIGVTIPHLIVLWRRKFNIV